MEINSRSWRGIGRFACLLLISQFPFTSVQAAPVPAQQQVVELGTGSVHLVEIGDRDDRPITLSPGIAGISTAYPNEPPHYAFPLLAQGMLAPGASEIVGLVGDQYTLGTHFEVDAYSRAGNTFTIVVRRSQQESAVKDMGAKSVWISAALPMLSDGHYRVELRVVTSASRKGPETRPADLWCDIDVPTATEKADRQERERLAMLSNQDLLSEYSKTGEGTRGLPACPRDVPVMGLTPTDFEDPRYVKFDRVR